MGEPCPAGCCPHDGDLPGRSPDPGSGRVTTGCPADLPDSPRLERIAHLYACRMLSTYRIAQITGIGRQRVNRMLRKAGIAVKPRGAGRPKAHRDDQARRLDELMAGLYLRLRLSSSQIGELTGIPAHTVRDRLHAMGVPVRTRGRHNREDRTVIARAELADLYVRAGLSADEVGRLFGVSRHVVLRSAHDAGLPVRIGGPASCRGPSQIELIEALYADAAVRKILARHGIPQVPPLGPIWQRFPCPQRLTAELATELYADCGLGLHHIELLTGCPGSTVSGLLHASGVPLRPRGGRSPFLRRWREGG